MKYGIIGFGCAGYNGAKSIREYDSNATIRVFNQTGEAPGNPMLTSYYAEKRIDDIGIYPFGSLSDIIDSLKLDITTTPVKHLNVTTKTVELDDGTFESFDKILIATGAVPVIPKSILREGYAPFALRTYNDIRKMIAYIDTHDVKETAVVGCSWVGIKAAEFYHSRGCHVTMIDGMNWLFPTAAYKEVVEPLYPHLHDLGVDFKFGNNVATVDDKGVTLANGEYIPSELTCLAIGVRSYTDIVKDEPIEMGRSIRVNEKMETSVPGIFAAGDCCEAINPQTGNYSMVGLWSSAYDQGECAGKNMAGLETKRAGEFPHNITHFFDMDFMGMGDITIPGKRVIFNGKNGTVEAVVKEDGQIASFNILTQYKIAGFLKNHMLKAFEGASEALSIRQKGQILAAGFSDDFADFLGGKR